MNDHQSMASILERSKVDAAPKDDNKEAKALEDVISEAAKEIAGIFDKRNGTVAVTSKKS